MASKRTRYIFPSHEIAHLWAHAGDKPDNPQRAANPRRNFSFDGPNLY